MKKKSVSVFAPATVGNVGVGFDILGMALDCIGDTVTVTKTNERQSVVIKKIDGAEGSADLPLDPRKNTATVGLIQLLNDLQCDFGFEVRIKKGIPLGSGMGGSAASAVGAAVAANHLLPKRLNQLELMRYALLGEAVASGGIHGDNVAPCLFGGLTLVRSAEPPDVVAIPVPSKVLWVLVHPSLRLETKTARAALNPHIALKDFVSQGANLSGFIAGCFTKDLKLLQRTFEDVVIEPQRRHLIRGFSEVKKAALKAGAWGCTISGAGPSLIAPCEGKSTALAVKRAMVKAFEDSAAGPCRAWVSSANKKGARVL